MIKILFENNNNNPYTYIISPNMTSVLNTRVRQYYLRLMDTVVIEPLQICIINNFFGIFIRAVYF